MAFLDTKHKKKSITLTTIVLSVILLLLFYVGLTYLDPPPENGISVNFGTMDFGAGQQQPKKPIQTAPTPKETSQPKTKATPTADPIAEKVEEVLTSDIEDSPVIPPKKKEVENASITPKPKEEVKEVPKEDPKPSKATTDALSSILNGPKSDGKETGSEGDDTKSGDKGDPKGDPYASSYYGTPGNGTGTGFGLNGRSLVSKGKVQQECNEEGRVVVKIVVDKNGKVVSATPGVRGTTNNHPCLLAPAKQTAFMHQWNLDGDAPAQQVGFVVVNFKLGE